MESEHSASSRFTGTHFWNHYSPGSFFTKIEYQKFIDEIKDNPGEYLGIKDIRNFLAMKPSRQQGDVYMKYYIMNDIIAFFEEFYGRDHFMEYNGEFDIIEDLFI
ncbi:MAG: hypothetical protein ACFFBF_12580 [Promethearchaeota archaeon]